MAPPTLFESTSLIAGRLVAKSGVERRCSAQGYRSSFSSVQIRRATPICLRLLMHLMLCPLLLARAREGNSKEARIAMIAITTNSSMRVKARRAQRNKNFIDVAAVAVAAGDALCA